MNVIRRCAVGSNLRKAVCFCSPEKKDSEWFAVPRNQRESWYGRLRNVP